MTRRCFVVLAVLTPLLASRAEASPPPIERIYIAHFSHTDFGFTDLQSVTRELQKRYLDIAVDAVLATKDGPPERKFYWTAESIVAVDDWWQAAAPARRAQLVDAVRSGQLEVAALPFNQTPFLNAAQWDTMLHWLPEDVWNLLNPQVALQDDVNGFPRAGVPRLLDRGIKHLMMGINSDSGGPPFFRPSAFWWKMPDGRRLFVWLNLSYPDGYDFFETVHWRHGPVPGAADTRYRPPHAGDFFRTDEASLRAAQAQCLRRIAQLQSGGYAYRDLVITVTNHWRCDNDPPFLPLPDFVAAWNKLGLKPELVYTTVSKAVKAMEKSIGNQAPEYQGEFTDWWANGTGSGPREVAASRRAKRLLAAVRSPLWDPLVGPAQRKYDGLIKDLCLFDEHTWGSATSVSLPWSLDTQAQFNEKAAFAYRPLGHAEWLLSQRVRSRLLREGEGLFVANPSPTVYSGWVKLIASCLRGDFKSLEPPRGAPIALRFENGAAPFGRPQSPADLTREDSSATFPDNVANQAARFWVEHLDGATFTRLRLSPATAEDHPADTSRPDVTLGGSGWPASARWPRLKTPLFRSEPGGLLAYKVNAFAPRWVLHDMAGADQATRDRLRTAIVSSQAEPEGRATLAETPHTLLYTQGLKHPRLRWATRTLELWKREPRARLTVRLDRLPSAEPEALFVELAVPCAGVLPTLSSGGAAFTPFRDQIPGCCRDYFAVDGWADYATPEGHWLWVTRDAPLVTLGTPRIWARATAAPPDPERVMSMVYNNFWYTNFAADEPGVMEFQYDLVWRDKLEVPACAAALAATLSSDPVVLINAAGTDHPIVLDRLFKP
jgi:Glycosyl hydrolases family 38 N-terminal domain